MRHLTERPLVLLSAGCLMPVLLGVALFSPHHAFSSVRVALGTLGFGCWVAFPAVFNLMKGLGSGSIVRSWRSSLILSAPSALSVALVLHFHLKRSDAQDAIGLALLPLGFFVILPLAWAVGRGYHDYFEPRPANNSFKPKPLRGSA